MYRHNCKPRYDLQHTAQKYGFNFYRIDGDTYWDESGYYSFTLNQIENDIEEPTNLIHEMSMNIVSEVVRNESLMKKLAIPEEYWDVVASSYNQGHSHLYGRMDFSYQGNGPAKLLELNYDTPTSLYEASFFQWIWLEQQKDRGVFNKSIDQFNCIQEDLILAFSTLAKENKIKTPLHFSAMRNSKEDQSTVDYLEDCAHQAGISTIRLAVEDIGLSIDGKFTNMNNEVIQTLFKLYPLEMMFEDVGGHYLKSSNIQLIEPAWKAILSNKGLLPLLWERHPNHPNLLPAFFESKNDQNLKSGWFRKPIFSREGANIDMRLTSGELIVSDGPYTDSPHIIQSIAPLPYFENAGYPLIGSWVVGDRACGIGIREDDTLITRDTARFIPHIIDG